jgi:Type I phosphodiesterase / nucleotide pyrophosphatase
MDMSLLRGNRYSRALGVACVAGATVALATGSLASAHKDQGPFKHGGGERHDQGDHHHHKHGKHGFPPPQTAQHVLLLSVDGLHQADLEYYVAKNPTSALAQLVSSGVEFTHAQTPVPSDSFPGMVAQATGGNPASTGVYYDDTFNHELLPAGTTSCAGVKPGVEVTYFEQLDKNLHSIDAGQGLAGLPGNILQMTGNPDELIDPTQLPVNPNTCKPVYPHEYLKVNTIFEVARSAGLRTAWSDKHPAYEILNGPSGTGVQDLFTPEINSEAPTEGSGHDWTEDNALTQQYDSYKVQSVINEINGFDHSGTTAVGTPGIFGMNFQTVSTAEKLPTSNGLTGGYLADGVTPGPLLSRALDYINTKVGEMLAAIKARHLQKSTVVVLSAKHGQSPDTPSALTRIPDGPIIEELDEAWKSAHPSDTTPLVAFSVDDDGMLIWLNDRSEEATEFAKAFLLSHSGTGNDINGNPKPYTSSGLAQVYAGAAAAGYFKVPAGDSRVPDVFGVSQYGVVYTGKQGKIAEHGGANPQDRDVPLLVSGDPVGEHGVRDGWVETTQIAPTILKLLGLDPNALQAVQEEHTQLLPLD